MTEGNNSSVNTEKPILICHNSENFSHALALALVLEMKGFRTWVYELDSPTGADRDKQEAEIISDCSVAMVALFSMASIEHPESIISELSLAKNRKRLDPSYCLAFYTAGVTWADLLNKMPQKKDLLARIAGNVIGLLELDPAIVMAPDFDLDKRTETDFLTKLFEIDLRGLVRGAPDCRRVEDLRGMLRKRVGSSQGRVPLCLNPFPWISDCGRVASALARYVFPKLRKMSAMEMCAPVGHEGRGSFEKLTHAERDPVDCTVYSPPGVRPSDRLFLQVYAHIPGHAEEVRTMARDFDSEAERRGFTSLGTEIQRGSVLTFELWIPGLAVEDAVQQITWRGRTEYVQFDVHIPLDHPPGSIIGKVSVSQDSVPIGLIRVKVKVVERSCPTDGRPEVCGESKRYNMAFISYASSDRSEVLKRVQMLSAVGISYFQDVLDLNPGELWARQLYRYIDDSDVLLLFWSSAARESEWVTKEWKYGLSQKGDEFIRPVVIEGPPCPLPPPELAHIHFSDRVLYFIR
jgi:hypothetical protein